jgi:hypothetical protein
MTPSQCSFPLRECCTGMYNKSGRLHASWHNCFSNKPFTSESVTQSHRLYLSMARIVTTSQALKHLQGNLICCLLKAKHQTDKFMRALYGRKNLSNFQRDSRFVVKWAHNLWLEQLIAFIKKIIQINLHRLEYVLEFLLHFVATEIILLPVHSILVCRYSLRRDLFFLWALRPKTHPSWLHSAGGTSGFNS